MKRYLIISIILGLLFFNQAQASPVVSVPLGGTGLLYPLTGFQANSLLIGNGTSSLATTTLNNFLTSLDNSIFISNIAPTDLQINLSNSNTWLSSQIFSSGLSMGGAALSFDNSGAAIQGNGSGQLNINGSTVTIDSSGNVVANSFGGNGANLTALNAGNFSSGILAIARGGTGTGSTPSYGQILVGNNSSGYTLTATSSLGLPSTVARADLTGQTTAITVLTYTPTATSTLNVGGYVTVTAIATDIAQFQVVYTDETSTSRTQTFTIQGATSANIAAGGAFDFPPMTIRAKANTTVTVQTVLTNNLGSITYDTGAWVEKI